MESEIPKVPYKDEDSSDEGHQRTPPPGYSVPPPGFNYRNNPPMQGQMPSAMPNQGPNPQVQYVQPVVIVAAAFGPNQSNTRCPNCSAEVLTSISFSPSTHAWIAFWVMCVLGCWFGCCCIPFCMDSCKKVTHRCPNCQNIIGVYQP